MPLSFLSYVVSVIKMYLAAIPILIGVWVDLDKSMSIGVYTVVGALISGLLSIVVYQWALKSFDD